MNKRVFLALGPRCSGFGRYQAVETRIRTIKQNPRQSCSGFGRYQAVETNICREKLSTLIHVAVGLAAIRPLKRLVVRQASSFCCCSGFGRYQAVETLLKLFSRRSPEELQWVWPLSGR